MEKPECGGLGLPRGAFANGLVRWIPWCGENPPMSQASALWGREITLRRFFFAYQWSKMEIFPEKKFIQKRIALALRG
jgi:hypothetical protein